MEMWLEWAIEIQSLAQAGLTYTDNVYDIERYERLREISAEIISEKSNKTIKDSFLITGLVSYKSSLYQILCKLFNFRIPSQIYLKLASSF